MKRLFFVFGLLLTGLAVNAQTAQPATAQQTEQTAQQRAHTQALRMQKNLSLSAEQTTQVEAVFLSRNEAIDKIKADASKTPEVKKKEIEQVKVDKDAELANILTPAQLSQYNDIKAKKAARKQASGGSEE